MKNIFGCDEILTVDAREDIMDAYSKTVTHILKEWHNTIEKCTLNALAAHGIEFDFEKYKNSRFTYFMAVTDQRDNTYTVYFNDGSVDGLHLFTIPIPF